MKARPHYLVLCAVLILGDATTGSGADNNSTSGVQIEMSDGLLSLAVQDAPMHDIVREIGELAGFETILVGDFINPPLVSVSFDNVSIGEAIERLISDRNRIILYRPVTGSARQRVVSQVWLLPSDEASGEKFASDAGSIASGREQDVKDYKLARLTRLLQQDQDVAVRERAAIALGTIDDERAVLALESALSDKDSSVRSQALNALGRIGSE